MGTDEFGRDILSRVMWGGRASLTVAVGAVVLAALVGVPLGLIAGYFGGWFGAFLMRLLDAVLAFPVILLAILIMSRIGHEQLDADGDYRLSLRSVFWPLGQRQHPQPEKCRIRGGQHR